MATTNQGKLSKQVAVCGDNLPILIHETQLQINAAVGAGDLDDAATLRKRMRDLSIVLGTILDSQIVEIDSSKQMTKAIAGFAKVNKAIKTQMSNIKDLQSFVDELNSLVGTLNTAVNIAFSNTAAGAAQSGSKAGAKSG